MAATINISTQSFGSSKNSPIFVVPNNVKGFESTRYISFRSIKAGFLSDNSTSVVLRCLATQKMEARLFCIYISQIFGQKMPNNDKNLTADAQGASASTPNTRKRVATRAKSAQSQPQNICKKFLQIKKSYLHLQCSDQEPNSANIVEVFLRPNLNGLLKSFVSVKSASAICTCSWSNKGGLAAFLISLHIVNFI